MAFIWQNLRVATINHFVAQEMFSFLCLLLFLLRWEIEDACPYRIHADAALLAYGTARTQ